MEFLDSELTEVQVSSEEIYNGKIVHLFRDAVRLPNGKLATREVMRHPGAAAVVLTIGFSLFESAYSQSWHGAASYFVECIWPVHDRYGGFWDCSLVYAMVQSGISKAHSIIKETGRKHVAIALLLRGAFFDWLDCSALWSTRGSGWRGCAAPAIFLAVGAAAPEQAVKWGIEN